MRLGVLRRYVPGLWGRATPMIMCGMGVRRAGAVLAWLGCVVVVLGCLIGCGGGEAPAGGPLTPTDTAAPVVTLVAPAGGASVSGAVTLSATATDNMAVTLVEFRVNGVAVATMAGSPYTFSWSSSSVANGQHTVEARAFDAAGNQGTASATISVNNVVTVGPSDIAAPTVSITSPSSGATVSGGVALAADATDDVGVATVTWRIGGTVVAVLTTPPFNHSWDSTTMTDGPHVVEVMAADAAGNQASSSIAVTVSNAVPPDSVAPQVSLTSPASSATVSGTTTIAANASDNIGVASVEFRMDGVLAATVTATPYSYAWDTSLITDGPHVLEVRAFDAAGNSANATIAVNVSNAVATDTTAPIVSFTAPAAAATVSGQVQVASNATDNVAIARVEFSINGTLAQTVTTSPYSFSWDTTAVINGLYVLQARAIDTSSNHSTAAIAVTVNNLPPPDTTPPSVSITAPLAAATVSGTTTITIAATDNVGVASVVVRINGVVAATLTTSPYIYSWNTASLANGNHTLAATATDAATNADTATISVTVSNAAPPTSNRVVMAYAENLWGAGGATSITGFDYTAITHIIHGFVLPDASGGLTQHANFLDFRTGGGWMPQNLPGAVHAAGKKIVMSIGGALPVTNATIFATIAASPTIRQTFITNVVAAIAAWGYDGVDIDYEWPNSILEGQQFTTLMQELHTAVKLANPNHVVIFGAGPGDKVGYKQWAQLAQWCDYCFFFGYDWHWGFPSPAPIGPITNPGTTFVASSGPSFERSVRGAVNYVLGQGFPASKLVIGIPFYSDNGTTWSNGGRADWQALTPLQRQNVHPDFREVLINGKYWSTPESIPFKLDALLKTSTSVLRDASNNPVAAAGVGWWEWGHENPTHGELTAAVKAWMVANP